MKTYSKLILIIQLFGASYLVAQTNLNFENWSGVDPLSWTTSNPVSQDMGGAQTVFQETSNPAQGTSSVKMVTGNCPVCPNFSIFGQWGPATPLPNPLGGLIQLGDFGGTGVPYNQRPISVDFKYKANPMGNDAGGFHIQLSKYNPSTNSTETVGDGYFEANAVVSDWTTMNIPIVYYSNLVPDTISIWATSSIGSIPDLSMFGVPMPPGLPTPVAGSEFSLDAIILNLPSCDGFTIAVTGTNETGPATNDGTATVSPSGGTGPYSYSWSNLSTSQSISGLMPGCYFVTVTDANQCQKTGTFCVAPSGCNLSVNVTGTNSTSNSIYTGDGTATVTISGGNAPYSILWNTGSTATTISNLPIGTYAVLVSEQNNLMCSVWGYYTVYGDWSTQGLNEEVYKTELTISPNPFASQTVVSLERPMTNATVIIENNVGEVVITIANISGNSFDLNRNKLSNGVYFVSIVENNAIIAKDKIVIID